MDHAPEAADDTPGVGALDAGQGGPHTHSALLKSFQLCPEVTGEVITRLGYELRGTV